MSHNSDDLISNVVEKSQIDPAFRAALLADAKAALSSSFGVSIPSNLTVRIVEEAANEVVIVLPSVGNNVSLEELAGVAGGTTSSWGPNCRSC